jgi:hypothetical protein
MNKIKDKKHINQKCYINYLQMLLWQTDSVCVVRVDVLFPFKVNSENIQKKKFTLCAYNNVI